MMKDERKVLRAQELILEDEDCRPRVVMKTDAQGGCTLQFHETGGAVRMSLGLSPDNIPRLSLTYGGGKGRIQLEANDELNTVGIVVAGPTGQIQLAIGVASRGIPIIGVLGQDGWLAYPPSGQSHGHSGGENEHIDWDALLRKQSDQ